jgi:glucoamylase
VADFAEDPAAPGAPGIEPRWTSSAKTGVGTALGTASRVWFTLSHGIVNELYFPRVDEACTRDLGFIVTADGGFFSEDKRDCHHAIETLAPGVPLFRVESVCADRRYQIEKTILTDPARDTLLVRVRFSALRGELADYRFHVLLAPHLGNRGRGNTAWLDAPKGVPMLLAEGRGRALALACSASYRARSAGFVGVSDTWQDLTRHGRMEWTHPRAENGNVALGAEIDLPDDGTFVLALGLGLTSAEASHRASASLAKGFDRSLERYLREWRGWQQGLRVPRSASDESAWWTGAMVLRTHESKSFAGGTIASLSVPWGASKGDDDLGGYHLVWPRDLVETAGALLALGAHEDARRVVTYLCATQEADGHWPQNAWLDGTPYWGGVQMDETALPILLFDLARRCGAIEEPEWLGLWPCVRRAASFLLRCGPVTPQDRWEEDPGYSPYTLATEVAALLAAADLAEAHREPATAQLLRETADAWFGSLDDWTYVRDTDLARRLGVDGYYVRIAPPDRADGASPTEGFVPIKNRPPGQDSTPAEAMVSPDALALVRFGLRAPDDPRVLGTVRAIDALLRVETPLGTCFRRYNGDGYGEHTDGSPFDGTGVGRLWPLLTGERAHYELAAGHMDAAVELRAALERFANDGGLLPEQIWDSPDIPERELWLGRPTGSAMPLVWAHAELLKLIRSLEDGAVFDLPPQTVDRYQKQALRSNLRVWGLHQKLRAVPRGSTLRILLDDPALVHWSTDGWSTTTDTATRDTGLDVHVADLATAALASDAEIVFTFRYGAERWDGTDHRVRIGDSR